MCFSGKSVQALGNRNRAYEVRVHNVKQWIHNTDENASDGSACDGLQQEHDTGTHAPAPQHPRESSIQVQILALQQRMDINEYRPRHTGRRNG